MLILCITTWDPDKHNEMVKRVTEKGLMIPDTTKVIGEWTDLGGGRSFRLFEADDPAAIMEAAIPWADLAKMEIIPVIQVQGAIDLVST